MTNLRVGSKSFCQPHGFGDSLLRRATAVLFCCVLFLCLEGLSSSLAGGLQVSPNTNSKAAMETLRPKRIALVIGIRKYNNRAWTDLRYPVRDARKIASFLTRQGRFDEVLTLLQPRQTTLQGVRQGLRWLRKRNRSEQDTVVIYLSGHGTIAQRRSGVPPERYLVTTDSTANMPKTGLPLAEIKALMKGIPSRRKVVILATCYVGQVKKDRKKRIKGLSSGIKGTYSLGWVSQTTLVLSAAGYMQPAYELDNIRGDVYTHFLLQCAQKSLAVNQKVTASQAHQCATPLTYRFVQKHLGRSQTPSIESKIMGKDNLFLAGEKVGKKRKRKPKTRFGWLRLLRHKYKRVAIRPLGSKGGVQEIQLPTAQAQGYMTMRLPLGHYTLRWQSPTGKTREKTIFVREGTMVSLTPDAQLDSSELNPPRSKSNEKVGGFLELGPDLQLGRQGYLNLRAGFASPYASIGLALGGTLSPRESSTFNMGEEPLFRFGLYGQFGYTFGTSRFDLFMGGHLGLGLWNTYETIDKSEMVFYFVYGPNVRARWWFSDNVALRLSVAMLFSLSPDRPAPNNTSLAKEYAWTHRTNFVVSIGFDFGGSLRHLPKPASDPEDKLNPEPASAPSSEPENIRPPNKKPPPKPSDNILDD